MEEADILGQSLNSLDALLCDGGDSEFEVEICTFHVNFNTHTNDSCMSISKRVTT